MITVQVTGPESALFERSVHDILEDVLSGLDNLPPTLVTTENDDSIRTGWI